MQLANCKQKAQRLPSLGFSANRVVFAFTTSRAALELWHELHVMALLSFNFETRPFHGKTRAATFIVRSLHDPPSRTMKKSPFKGAFLLLQKSHR